MLCLAGVGQAGLPLAEAFLRAGLPTGVNGLVFTGPLMLLAVVLTFSFFRLTLNNIKAVGDEVDWRGNW